jgi:hypothetical protein
MKHVVVEKTNPSHLLHLVLTLFTGGLWLLVWPLISICYSIKRNRLRHQSQQELDANPSIISKAQKIISDVAFWTFCVAMVLVNAVILIAITTQPPPPIPAPQAAAAPEIKTEVVESPGTKATRKDEVEMRNLCYVVRGMGAGHLKC